MGTCRMGNLHTTFIDYINPYMRAGQQSKTYNYKNTRIDIQPITYTTKLSDVRDVLKYMQGNVENNIDPNYLIDPNENINFFKTFFRGHWMNSYDQKLLKKPGEPINGIDNNYDLYIFEVCSLREIKFKNSKYGKEFEGKNLLWNIITNYNSLNFEVEDFEIIHNDIDVIKNTLNEINQLINNKPILIIGPYLLNKDMLRIEHDIDMKTNEYVNNSRKEVQNILKEVIKLYPNIEYFDMTEEVKKQYIIVDDTNPYHFNNIGQKIMSDIILNWIEKQIS